MRWDGGRGHYEVWYATLSDPATRNGFWIRMTLEAPFPEHGDPYCQLWFARFDPARPGRTFGVNRRFPIEMLAGDRAAPVVVRIGDHELSDGGMRGRIEPD